MIISDLLSSCLLLPFAHVKRIPAGKLKLFISKKGSVSCNSGRSESCFLSFYLWWFFVCVCVGGGFLCVLVFSFGLCVYFFDTTDK